MIPHRLALRRIDEQHHALRKLVDRHAIENRRVVAQQERVHEMARFEQREIGGGDPVDVRVPVGAGDLELADAAR